jgi:branched-chain amino acid transport system substrate-binding protein
MKHWIRGLFIPLLLQVSIVSYADTIPIAAIYALSGPAAMGNSYSLAGVRLAVAELNQKGGVLGKLIELQTFDNQSTPIGSHMAAQQAAEAGVAAIIGAPWSTHSLPIAKVAQENGIPMISDFSTHPGVTAIGDFIFRVCFTDDFQGRAMARFAQEDLKAATCVIFINLTSEYSIYLANIIQQDFEARGGQSLARIEYKPNQPSFAPLVQKAMEADADVMFLTGHDESGLILKEAQGQKIRSIPLGGDGWSVESFFIKGGNLIKRGYYCTHWSKDMESQASDTFLSKYQDKVDLDPGMALAYDAIMLLADAIRRAGSLDRNQIRDALAMTRAFPGVTGTISFDENGDPLKNVVIMEIRDGRSFYLKTMQ